MAAAAKVGVPGRNPQNVGRRSPVRYDRDLYTWSVQQAAALRSGRFAAVDVEHVAEEIEDLGKAEFSKLESALRIILLHMSKWDRQAERRSRSWVISIDRERLRYGNVLGDNPGLKSKRTEALTRAYATARLDAAEETSLPRAAFPVECPYSLDEVLHRPFEWPET